MFGNRKEERRRMNGGRGLSQVSIGASCNTKKTNVELVMWCSFLTIYPLVPFILILRFLQSIMRIAMKN